MFLDLQKKKKIESDVWENEKKTGIYSEARLFSQITSRGQKSSTIGVYVVALMWRSSLCLMYTKKHYNSFVSFILITMCCYYLNSRNNDTVVGYQKKARIFITLFFLILIISFTHCKLNIRLYCCFRQFVLIWNHKFIRRSLESWKQTNKKIPLQHFMSFRGHCYSSKSCEVFCDE